MEYRIKEKRVNDNISYQIQFKRRFLFLTYWRNYIKEHLFFGECYLQEFCFDDKGRALLEFRLLKDRSETLTLYHY